MRSPDMSHNGKMGFRPVFGGLVRSSLFLRAMGSDSDAVCWKD
jgi:hypothetical protein